MPKRTSEAEPLPAPVDGVVGMTKVLLEGEQVNASIATASVAPTGDGPITFDMYMTVRNVPAQRRAGMRAFTAIQSATLADWNRIFRNY
jgi:hypothetical protein